MKNAIPFAFLLALAAPVFSSASPAAPAQEEGIQFPQASPLCFVRNQIGLTTVEIEYSRPGVKDRKIFGGLVPYDEMWRTGANAATKVTFSGDVTFGGQAVPAGTYALFTVPGKKEWAVVLSKNTGQWGSYAYNESDDVARVTVKPTNLGQPVETMAIGIDHIRTDSGHLTITWDKTRVAVPIKTDLVATLAPKIEAFMASDSENKPYLQAAMFYYEHDLDIEKSLAWISAAEEAQPDAVWVVYRKGLVLAKAGKMDAAFAAAEKAMELADAAGGELGAEYRRLSESLIESLDS